MTMTVAVLNPQVVSFVSTPTLSDPLTNINILGAQLQRNRSDINKFVELHLIKRKVISAAQYAGSSTAMRTKLEEIAADIEDAAASYLPDPQASAQVQVEPVGAKKDEKKKKPRQWMDSSSDGESNNEEEETPLKKKQKMGAQNTVVKRIGLGPRKKAAWNDFHLHAVFRYSNAWVLLLYFGLNDVFQESLLYLSNSCCVVTMHISVHSLLSGGLLISASHTEPLRMSSLDPR